MVQKESLGLGIIMKRSKMKQIHLLIGGAGFIGSALAKKFDSIIIDKKRNNDVIFNFEKTDNNSIKKLAQLIGSKIDPNSIIIVQHLACNLGVENVINSENYIFNDNIMNLNIRNFLIELQKIIADKRSKIDQFLYYSTSEVYGEQSVMMPNSNYIIPSIIKDTWRRNRYAVSKINNEFLWKEYCISNNIEYKIIRPFNVTGPYQSKDFVIPKMLNSAIKENKIIIYGKGDQKRTFTDIRDFVESIDYIIKYGKKEIYNIANLRNNISIKELAEMIKGILEINAVTKEKINIEFLEVEQELIGDKKRVPDVKDLYELYIPKYTIKDIIYNILETEYPERI